MHRSEQKLRVVALALTSLLVATACGDSEAESGGGGSGGSGQPAGGAGGAGGETGGAGGGTGGENEGGFPPFEPGPDDVMFEALGPVPEGESILFNDWNPIPNELNAIAPDGTGETNILRVYRIWSMAVSADVSTIAMSTGDPDQEEHYGITIGDAIQPTFIYDVATQEADNLTFGNINDECHRFGASGDTLYLCRRYDFDAEGASNGYRIGKVDIATKAFEWLTEEEDDFFTLHPEPNDDETSLYFTRIPVPTGDRTIVSSPLPDLGQETLVRSKAGTALLSKGGTRLLFQDYSQMGSLVALDLETDETVLIAQGPGVSTGRWSPDGANIVYLRDDETQPCSHIHVAPSDGSQPEGTRIHDCVESGRFITELEWVSR